MLEALEGKEQEYVLDLRGMKIECTANGKVSNKQRERLGKANKMQEKTRVN